MPRSIGQNRGTQLVTEVDEAPRFYPPLKAHEPGTLARILGVPSQHDSEGWRRMGSAGEIQLFLMGLAILVALCGLMLPK